MADYIDMEITVHGEITSAEALNALAEAMAKDLDSYEDDPAVARAALLEANREDEGLTFVGEARNGTVDEIKAAAIAHKIDMTVFSGIGPGWGASTYFVRDGVVSFSVNVVDSEICVSKEIIDKLRARGLTTLDELYAFIDIFDKAKDMPKFSVSDEVIAEMFMKKRR